ncbi:uncharacterized protein Z519_00147 [Cladophialophora bantiana CBS 173.52]|uniref:NADH:flavin oxidoreductase/NADH oxidase N-terminal domain-containing protein n=1 Tax=Cladophialophora bantiana (strain ATCC 10958 / CBS 173.52 / CDC B-1940 / NIH 8579) TaxID=1442370 RepID=A0A0D2F8U9_CLAB1|nr:uncharacterized protein Z519_00147 [Cladophialophora bantiana CBS 173.52]KIW98486.1 hypothetical protein Z519_00147 [Cladophialophora bantiana CBS 173.52]
MAGERLFSPLQLGNVTLDHRIVMAPLTRYRADEDGVPIDIVRDYYTQRASTPGTLIITEATLISPRASGIANVPGIWNSRQIAAWKKITDAVHEKECFVFLQLWALGRRADAQLLQCAEGGPYPVVSASAMPAEDGARAPHALTPDEIQLFIDDFASAAKNAMAAGFDGVEIHGANGYLLDQFLQDVCNHRTDNYGGSIENRARFGLEVTQAIITAVSDSKKVAIRLSPWTDFDGKRMVDPVPQFCYMISELKKLGLAYLHLVESRYAGDVATASYHVLTRRNDPFIKLWGPLTPIILAGGFTPETAKKVTEELYADSNLCIAFGRFYISSPDLPYRIRENIQLNPYLRESFYLKMSHVGYTDYPFSPEFIVANAQKLSGSL